jgi:hypothetical protein
MNESHLDTVVLWLVSGMSDQAIAAACSGKLGLAPDDAKAAIDEARRRITLAADYRRDEMIGQALTRLNDLYGRCLRRADEPAMLTKALDVQKEINRLAGLHAKSVLEVEPDTHNEELDAIAAHLLPLKLAGEAYPLREHARLAAQKIREMMLSQE